MPFSFRLLVATTLLVLGSQSAQAARFTGVVTTVTDVDTVWVRPQRGGAPRPVRIEGIDAPEICQTFGPRSRDALSTLLLRQKVVVTSARLDGNGRVLARLPRGEEDVGETMVLRGFAWSYRFRGDPGPYADEEKRARKARAGLWADDAPLMPRDFRVRHGSCRPR